MPTYDYKCFSCFQYWSETRLMDARHDNLVCPHCGGVGKLVIKTAPTVPWFPGTTRSPYTEKRRHH